MIPLKAGDEFGCKAGDRLPPAPAGLEWRLFTRRGSWHIYQLQVTT